MQQMTDEQMQALLNTVCNKGPYTLDFAKSTNHVQVWTCQACGAELRWGTTVSIPSQAHYKPAGQVSVAIESIE